MAFEKPAVVIDNGSYFTKAGFACDNHPVAIFRTLVGRPKRLMGKYGRVDYYDVFIGDEALDFSEDYDLTSPIQNGNIVQWDNVERIWHRIFYKDLKVAPEDRGVFYICSPLTPMVEKVKCCQIFFEVLNVPAICIQPTSVLALYGSGCTSGLTVDLGFDNMSIDPVYEGGTVQYAHMTTKYAGRDVCEYLADCFAARDIDLGNNPLETLNSIIKDNVHVTQDSAMPRKGYEKYFTLPSGEKIDVSQEVFMAGEMFFQPHLVMGGKSKYESIHEAVIMSILKCDSELRDELYSGLVMSGGLSLIPGIAQRLKKLVEETLSRPVNVLTSDESNVVSWMGGACFAGITEAQRIWITKKQFEDHGAKIVRNRFM